MHELIEIGFTKNGLGYSIEINGITLVYDNGYYALCSDDKMAFLGPLMIYQVKGLVDILKRKKVAAQHQLRKPPHQ